MRTKFFSSLLVAVLFIFALEVSSQDQAPAPVFKEGDFWQFKVTEKDLATNSSEALNGTWELSYSQGGIKGFILTGEQKEEIELKSDHPTDLLLVLLGSSKIRQDLKFPLSVGQKWSYDFRYRPIGARSEQTRSVEVRVVGIEEVRTAAGTFRTFKIEKEESGSTRRGVNHQVTTYFYSPATKSIAKSLYQGSGGGKRETELIKFGSASK